MTCAHFGVFWTRIRGRYPKVSEQPPLEPVFETFGGTAIRPMLQQIRINTLLKPPVPRFVFEAAEGQDLVQVQQDRIMHNWRRVQDSDVYPRYESVRAHLKADIDEFSAFLAEEKLGEFKPNQCEVAYINVITLDPSADPHREVSRVMTIANQWPTGDNLPVLENTLIQTRTIYQREGEPTCRLYLQLQPVLIGEKGTPAVQLDLTARGKPNGDSLDEVFALLDFAREGIVRTFTAVTTRDLHNVWGRLDVN
jgi:uncharacterized protein (TIGR04255 family)